MLKDVLKPIENEYDDYFNKFKIIVSYKKENNMYNKEYFLKKIYYLFNLFPIWLWIDNVNNGKLYYNLFKPSKCLRSNLDGIKTEIKEIVTKEIAKKMPKPKDEIIDVNSKIIFGDNKKDVTTPAEQLNVDDINEIFGDFFPDPANNPCPNNNYLEYIKNNFDNGLVSDKEIHKILKDL